MQLYIFGAKALALGMYRALSELYPEFPIQGFLVSPLKDNAPTLAGLPVMDLLSIRDKNIHILIATTFIRRLRTFWSRMVSIIIPV